MKAVKPSQGSNRKSSSNSRKTRSTTRQQGKEDEMDEIIGGNRNPRSHSPSDRLRDLQAGIDELTAKRTALDEQLIALRKEQLRIVLDKQFRSKAADLLISEDENGSRTAKRKARDEREAKQKEQRKMLEEDAMKMEKEKQERQERRDRNYDCPVSSPRRATSGGYYEEPQLHQHVTENGECLCGWKEGEDY